MLAVTILALLASPLPAHAGNMCKSLGSIQGALTECEDNLLFSQAGEACANSYRGMVKASQAKLASALQAQTAAKLSDKSGATAMQAEAEGVSAGAYAKTISSVSELIAKGLAARAEVEAYRKNLLWPFTWSAAMGPKPSADDPSVQASLDKEYCYGEHAEIIRDSLADFDKMIAELTAAKTAALRMQGVSTAHQGNLNGGSTPAATTGGKKSVAPAPTYDGDPKRGRSDISGTKEEAARKAGKK